MEEAELALSRGWYEWSHLEHFRKQQPTSSHALTLCVQFIFCVVHCGALNASVSYEGAGAPQGVRGLWGLDHCGAALVHPECSITKSGLTPSVFLASVTLYDVWSEAYLNFKHRIESPPRCLQYKPLGSFGAS